MEAMPSSPRRVPLKHERIAKALLEQIRRGDFPADEPLPSETALGRRFAASRNTVRQALALLTDQGLIVTRPGVGSFVAFRPVDEQPHLGWAGAIQQRGAVNHVRLVSITAVDADALPAAIGAVARPPAACLLRVVRVRSVVGDRVISLECSLLPAVPPLADLPERGLVDDSIVATLRSAGLTPASGEQWVEVGALDAEDAALWRACTGADAGLPAGGTVLVSRCVTRTADGALAEYVESQMDPTYFRLHLRF